MPSLVGESESEDDDSDAEYLGADGHDDLKNFDSVTSLATKLAQGPHHDVNTPGHAVVSDLASNISPAVNMEGRVDGGAHVERTDDLVLTPGLVVTSAVRHGIDEGASTDSDDDAIQPAIDYGDKRVVHLCADTLLGATALIAVDVNGVHHGDLIDDHTWRQLELQVKQQRGSLLRSPPATTCSDEAIAHSSHAAGGRWQGSYSPQLAKTLQGSVESRGFALYTRICLVHLSLRRWGTMGSFLPRSGRSIPTLQARSQREEVATLVISIGSVALVIITSSSYRPRTYDYLEDFCARLVHTLTMEVKSQFRRAGPSSSAVDSARRTSMARPFQASGSRRPSS